MRQVGRALNVITRFLVTFYRNKQYSLIFSYTTYDQPMYDFFCLVIDKDHLKKYPYCGSMHYSPDVQSRAVNAKDAKHLYRWVLLLGRSNIQKDGEFKKTWCQGSVITER